MVGSIAAPWTQRVWDRYGIGASLLILIALKVILQVYLYHVGFISVSADEHSRGIQAAAWLASDDSLPIYTKAWLPFELYLNAAALSLWNEVVWAPRLTAFLCSCLLLIFYFLLVRELFSSTSIAFIASLMLVFYPWCAWLSGTPMLDIYYLAFFVAGLLFLLRWLRRRRGRLLVLSSFFFILSTGFHSQSWILVNTVNLIAIFIAIRLLYDHSFKEITYLFCYVVSNNAFIGYYLVLEFLETGRWLAFFAEHATYSRSVRGGYDVGPLRRLLYYPGLVVRSAPVAVLLLPASLSALWWAGGRLISLVPFLVGAIGLLIFCAFNLVSVPATAAPGRYALPFFVLFSPYMAHGLVVLLGPNGWVTDRWKLRPAAAPLVCAALLVILSYAWRIDGFPRETSPDDLRAGRNIAALIDRSDWRPGDTFMVELDYWEFLAVQLTAGHYDSAIFDREFDRTRCDTPSIFLTMSSDEVLDHLRSRNTKLIAATSPEVKAAIDRLDFVETETAIGRWSIYRVSQR
jgi:hypothetical protein